MARRMGKWQCGVCQTVMDGPVDACTSCGSAKPQDVKYFLPENAPAVTNPQQLKEASAGPNWTCEHCDSSNDGDRQDCRTCGAARGSSPNSQVRTYRLEDVPRTPGDPQPARPQELASGLREEPRLEPLRVESLRGLNPMFLVIPVAVVVALLVWWLWPTKTYLTVSGYRWERSVTIEARSTVVQEGLSVPEGARQLNSQTKQNGTQPVLDHYVPKSDWVCNDVQQGTKPESYEDCQDVVAGTEEYVCGETDLGNGYFEDVMCERDITEEVCDTKQRQVPNFVEVCEWVHSQQPVYRQDPVFATFYTYEIDVWNESQKPALSGQDHRPMWPTFSLAANEREKSRQEKYVVLFSDSEGNTYSKELPIGEWEMFDLGQQVHAKVVAGQITEFINE